MTITQTDRLYVCQDCYYWGQYGWEPGTDYPEGWAGPDHPALLGAVYVQADCPADQECCCGHFSWQQCQGCGSGLGGDRYYIATFGRQEGLL